MHLIEGIWKQFQGRVKEKWGQLTDEDLDQAAGERDQVIGTLQKRYGCERDRAERGLDEVTVPGRAETISPPKSHNREKVA